MNTDKPYLKLQGDNNKLVYGFSTPDWLWSTYGVEIDNIITEISNAICTPFNILIAGLFSAQVIALQNTFLSSGSEVRFGGKAWFHPVFLKEAIQLGIKVCASSIQEVELALLCGLSPSKIVFMQPGVDANTIEYIVSKGVNIYLESLFQAYVCAQLPKNIRPRKVGIRVAADIGIRKEEVSVVQDDFRLGIMKDELKVVKAILSNSGITVTELLGHVGSLINSPKVYSRLLNALANLVELFPTVEIINLGGGLPFGYIDEVILPPLAKYGAEIDNIRQIVATQRVSNISIAFEPGRLLCAPAAIQVVRITDIKERNGTRVICFSDGQINSLGIDWPTAVLSDKFPNGWGNKTIVGGLCSPRDTISTRLSCMAGIGSLVAIGGIGAYAVPLAPASLQNRRRPVEILLAKPGQWSICRTPFDVVDWLERIP